MHLDLQRLMEEEILTTVKKGVNIYGQGTLNTRHDNVHDSIFGL